MTVKNIGVVVEPQMQFYGPGILCTIQDTVVSMSFLFYLLDFFFFWLPELLQEWEFWGNVVYSLKKNPRDVNPNTSLCGFLVRLVSLQRSGNKWWRLETYRLSYFLPDLIRERTAVFYKIIFIFSINLLSYKSIM